MVFTQQKKGLPAACWRLIQSLAAADELVVAGLHALLGERAGVLDLLLADPAPARLLGGVVGIGRPAVHHAARAEAFAKLRKVLRIRVVGQLRLLLGVQVIQVAEELVEAVGGRQELVQVSEVVLAELAGGVAERLQQLGNGRVLGLEADRCGRHADLGEAGAEDALPGDERGAARRAALLAVGSP